MVRHVSSRALGLFVTVGVILGVVAIIWVGASKYFEKGDRFVTYFNEASRASSRTRPSSTAAWTWAAWRPSGWLPTTGSSRWS